MPVGFTEKDAYPNAPRLFSDSFTLYYLFHLSNRGMVVYAKALAMVTRPDIHEYFMTCMTSAAELHTRLKLLLLNKGLYIRPPAIPKPTEAQMLERQSFLQGYLGKGRALNALEIANCFH